MSVTAPARGRRSRVEQPRGPATAPTFVKRPSRRSRVSLSTGVFFVSFALYLLLGWRITLHLHVTPGDAVSRLAHAYYVFWNAPAKLAAVGFVWPPLITAVFLPLVVLKPLGSSLWALPIMSALVGAALLTSLASFLGRCGMPALQRLALVTLFGVNPMIACYASNGMSEILGMWLLALAVAAFVRWHDDVQPKQLILIGIFLGLGALVRYELALWVLVLLPAIAWSIVRRRGRAVEFEASMVAILAPIAYGLGVWTFLNWSILGSPFAWLSAETTQTFAWSQGADYGTGIGRVTLLDAVRVVSRENVELFALVPIAALVALVVGIARRSIVGSTLAAALILNALSTIAIAVHTNTAHIFELRFNTRAMPLVLVTVGWLYSTARTRAQRLAIWGAAAVSLVACIPLTWHAMKAFPYRLDESMFTAAVATGKDQSHLIPGIDPVADERMAAYILAHTRRRDSVLTDDAETFEVILATGHPDLFVDRVDHGDARWIEVARNPADAGVRYVLVSWIDRDLVTSVYPHLYASGKGRGLRLVLQTRTSKLFRVVGPTR
jgi:hypothetical protein